MSAQTFAFEQTKAPASLAVSFRVVLGLYAIIPLCLLLQGLDSLLWDHYLLKNLPSSPRHFLLFQILFGTPHILASSLILGSNSDYFHFFKTQIITVSLAIILVFGLGSLFLSYRTLYVLTVFLTVFHVLKQQHGIARGVCRLTPRYFYSLLGISVLAGICIYLGIFLRNSLTPEESAWIKDSSTYLCLALIVMTLISQQYVTTPFGKLFLWSNTLLVLSSFYFYRQEYYLLAIMIPRVVHDATAYIFYVTHDYNREQQHPGNPLYRLAQRCNVHVFLVLPLLSFALTFLLQTYGDMLIQVSMQYLFSWEVNKAITVGLIGYLSLMHYFMEGLTWKQGSPYRQFIKFKM